LYQNGSGPTYQIGANNSAVSITSGGSNGVLMYYNSGSSGATGSKICTVDGSGNVISQAGIHANSQSSTNLAQFGMCAHMHYASSNGSFFTYNYNSSTYGSSQFGRADSLGLNINSSGLAAFGGTNALGYQCEFAFQSVNLTGGYGYFNSSASTGTGSSTGTQNFSALFTGRVAVHTELDVYSDRRIKTDIREVSDNEAIAFVEGVKPVHYTKTDDDSESFGYIAQDICRVELGLPAPDGTQMEPVPAIKDLIQLHPYPDLPETTDEDGFVSPADHVITVNYGKICSILHKYILIQKKQIDDHQSLIDELTTRVQQLDLSVTKPASTITMAKVGRKKIIKITN
jgi:hypothetical protein